MKKKLILAAAGAMAVFSLAACSSGSKDIATMKGSTITVDDFYNQIKGQSTSQQVFSQMVVYKVFEDKYGNKVTDKDVQKKFDDTKEQLEAQGTKFTDALKQYGLTEKDLKKQLKQTAAFQEGMKAHLKITDKDLKTAWANFHPEVEAQIIQVASEDDAKAVKKEITDGGDFAKIAKDKSTDAATKKNGGKIKFDSQSTTVPAEVKEAAFKLKDDEVSEPIAATNAQTYQTTYYVVKMTKNKAKGNDMKPYEKEIKKIAEKEKLSDTTFQTTVISDELKAANVKIKDDAFKNALAGYMQTESSSASSEKKESKSSDSKTSDTKTSDSEKATDSSSKTTESSSK
ncbi:peptidylprolyl isomerase [Enterococcus sp. DIV0086]|uniref:peptidylprolyl isomerase n=1 Tax=Enterococcus sp. DIV0086 TaxID=2774655 RepID=UPI003D266BE0